MLACSSTHLVDREWLSELDSSLGRLESLAGPQVPLEQRLTFFNTKFHIVGVQKH